MSRKGFTLIELLVVIAILGVIAAFLLPVLGRAREQSKRIHCVNNLRQHGIAWYMYLDDNDETFPAYGKPIDGKATETTFGGKQGSSFNGDYGAQYRVLNRYVDIKDESSSNVELFHCPGDTNENFDTLDGSSFDMLGNSYFINTTLIWPVPAMRTSLNMLTRSQSKVYLEMCNMANNPGHGTTSERFYALDIPVMVLFMDGHAAGPFVYDDDFEGISHEPDKPVWTNGK